MNEGMHDRASDTLALTKRLGQVERQLGYFRWFAGAVGLLLVLQMLHPFGSPREPVQRTDQPTAKPVDQRVTAPFTVYSASTGRELFSIDDLSGSGGVSFYDSAGHQSIALAPVPVRYRDVTGARGGVSNALAVQMCEYRAGKAGQVPGAFVGAAMIGISAAGGRVGVFNRGSAGGLPEVVAQISARKAANSQAAAGGLYLFDPKGLPTTHLGP